MRIAIVTDAWRPQVNGVVTTLSRTAEGLERHGNEVRVFGPSQFRTVPCPTYPEIRLALAPGRRLARGLGEFAPEALHIATEGPLGWAGRRWCLRRGLAFTTSYHTRFPEYVRLRAPVPERWMYALVRRFHRRAARTLVATPSMRDALLAHGFERLAIWTRGVDTTLFRPQPKDALAFERPITLYVGRVAVEKNLGAFLDLDRPGTRVVIGDGPARAALEAAHPRVRFLGYHRGEDLARTLAAADVFVFPSLTDTFGLVMLEAMACGVPVAAFPVPGPIDLVRNGINGWLHQDLGVAVSRALEVAPATCRAFAKTCSWDRSLQQFMTALVRTDDGLALFPPAPGSLPLAQGGEGAVVEPRSRRPAPGAPHP